MLWSSLDISRPWFATVHNRFCQWRDLCPVDDHSQRLAAFNQLAQDVQLHNHRGIPVRFVPQQALPTGVAYEAFISDTGQVPTRDNAHDVFNALMWLSLPRTKQRLNALQAEQLARVGVQATRGALRDMATVMDENALLWVVPDNAIGAQLVELLRQRRWSDLLLEQRHHWQRTRVCVFGHALLEKLLTPFKAITAHVYVLRASESVVPRLTIADIDALLSSQLSSPLNSPSSTALSSSLDLSAVGPLSIPSPTTMLSTKPFLPLPVLGIPGWHDAQDAAFYADARVFRR